MRFKPLKSLGLILSLSKDEDAFSGFFSILLDAEPSPRNALAAYPGPLKIAAPFAIPDTTRAPFRDDKVLLQPASILRTAV
jgi:hypothetical protein